MFGNNVWELKLNDFVDCKLMDEEERPQGPGHARNLLNVVNTPLIFWSGKRKNVTLSFIPGWGDNHQSDASFYFYGVVMFHVGIIDKW